VRTAVLVSVAALAASLVPGLPAAGQEQIAWPTLQGDPAHSGSVADPEALAPPLRREWEVGLSGDARLSSAVAVTDLGVANGPDKVVAFHPSTGEMLWTADRSRGALDPPALVVTADMAGPVVTTEGNAEESAGLVAIDPMDRSRTWRVALDAPARGAPTIAEGTVFVGSHTGAVRAVDSETGDVRWTFDAQGRVDTAPAVADGLVFFVAEDFQAGATTLHAVDKATGRQAWSLPQPAVSVRVSSPTVADGLVHVGFGDLFVRAVDAEDGTLAWEEPVRGVFSPLSVPAHAEGDLFIADLSGTLYRLDGRTGETSWDFQFPSRVARGSPLVAGDVVYVGLDDGTLAAVEIATGDLVWSTRFREGPIGALTPAGDLLLVPVMGDEGGIVALRRDPGGTLTRVESPTRLRLSAALLNFLGAFAILGAGLTALFRFALRPRDRRDRYRRGSRSRWPGGGG
jgi:outer membrane protein assembly factor BamB